MLEDGVSAPEVNSLSWTRSPEILQGIRVLELADETASFCGKLLADLGAEVVKVELPGADASGGACDASRLPLQRASFSYHNCGKRSITLDFKQAAGLDILLDLVSRSDVVLESFSPGVMGKLGMSYEVLQARNSRLILASVAGFGQSGPRSHWKSCDLVAAACGGQVHVTGTPGEEPLKLAGTQALYLGSLHAALGIVMALIQRDATGQCDHLDISLQEAVASGLDHVLVRYFNGGEVANRCGSRTWNALSFITPCLDGWLQIFPFQQWDTLVGWMDSEGMAGVLTDPIYQDTEYRRTHFDEIVEVISRWSCLHARQELFETGQLMGFPWGPVSTLQEVLESPQLKQRDFFVSLQEGPSDLLRQPSPPYVFLSETASVHRSLPPGLGSRQILREELGITDAELTRLASMGVI